MAEELKKNPAELGKKSSALGRKVNKNVGAEMEEGEAGVYALGSKTRKDLAKATSG